VVHIELDHQHNDFSFFLFRSGTEQPHTTLPRTLSARSLMRSVVREMSNRVEPFIFRISNDKKHSKM
jgi:hypothetical protein